MTNCKSWSMWIFLFLNSLFAENYLKNLTIIIKKIKSFHCLFIGKKILLNDYCFHSYPYQAICMQEKRVGDAIYVIYVSYHYTQIFMFSTASLLAWTGLWICSSARCETTLNKVKRRLQDLLNHFGPQKGQQRFTITRKRMIPKIEHMYTKRIYQQVCTCINT